MSSSFNDPKVKGSKKYDVGTLNAQTQYPFGQ